MADWVAITGLGLGIVNALYAVWNEFGKPGRARQAELRRQSRELLEGLQTWHRTNQQGIDMAARQAAIRAIAFDDILEKMYRLRDALNPPLNTRIEAVEHVLSQLKSDANGIETVEDSHPRYAELEGRINENFTQLNQKVATSLTLIEKIDNAGPLVYWFRYRRPRLKVAPPTIGLERPK